ncbi:copper homeostasis protein CutC [Pseudoflavitalea sp. X16]|uniref:copper homeostasis protein CutC n=1 Tax=Paraflavitalea devenefica TaxID=2716334 RepID=UPI001422F117|nr:copper homeostasis protein CutC [Paraflavitalea devenefica]NII26700.1 copper homeostasis protein CutC [Paraflavitalea devenefica]
MPEIILEVCAFNIQSCIIAEKVGAARVELCDNPVEGGTTPSHGAIQRTRERINIELYPIIRPRTGNSWYDEDEFAIMKKDILLCKELGCDGISTGAQLQNGEIDTERMKRMVEWAYPMGVTCHRVFDRTPDPFKALEEIIGCGCERVLTSGQRSAAPDATEMLARLVQQANGRIIIMPGAGIRASNIEKLIKETGATEYHTSARITVPDLVTYQNPAILDSGDVVIANEEELRQLLANAQKVKAASE